MKMIAEAPINALGATEKQWNEWIEATAEYRKANPTPLHTPFEVCTCENIPRLASRDSNGHCAAVGDIVPWVAKQ